MVAVFKSEGVYRALRDCPYLKEFTDEQLRELADGTVEDTNEPADGETADAGEEEEAGE